MFCAALAAAFAACMTSACVFMFLFTCAVPPKHRKCLVNLFTQHRRELDPGLHFCWPWETKLTAKLPQEQSAAPTSQFPDGVLRYDPAPFWTTTQDAAAVRVTLFIEYELADLDFVLARSDLNLLHVLEDAVRVVSEIAARELTSARLGRDMAHVVFKADKGLRILHVGIQMVEFERPSPLQTILESLPQ
jgi:hypothetical protein